MPSRRMLEMQLRLASGVQTAALVGALEVDQAVARSAAQRDDLAAALLERRPQRLYREGMMHGVARAGVRELEFQMRVGWQAGPRAPQCNSRRRELAQGLPGIRDGRGFRPVHRPFFTQRTTARAGTAGAAPPKDAAPRRAPTRRASAATPRIPARAGCPAPGVRTARRGTTWSGS